MVTQMGLEDVVSVSLPTHTNTLASSCHLSQRLHLQQNEASSRETSWQQGWAGRGPGDAPGDAVTYR